MNLKPLVFAGAVAGALLAGTHLTAGSNAADDVVFSPVLAAMNARLRAAGVTTVTIAKAELFFDGSVYRGDQATTIVANDRTHLLPEQFVENDPRRGGSSDISYLVDRSDGAALSFNSSGGVIVLPNTVTEAELDTSMAVWGNMNCNGPGIVKVPDTGADPDLVDGIVFNNPALIGTPFADITHAGWLPGAFFDAVFPPNGSAFVLAATFTFVFVDANGNLTDIDRNRLADAAFRETYYNLRFAWGTGGNPANIDIQSVAIHESGHGFGLAHFGKLFLKESGVLQFAPKAIMNAAYAGEDREIRGTDNASFCHIWANGR
jgi:hypothetical protein